ncbi:hypothetical protein PV08_06749 [Exophiala spinifera]|uniref:Uncharacterized protein n=1 Tax=Exophiala spinifera TaxID=91928 RepID=A0A0D2B4Z4_9EURO|nr:uncharacterized protein PV08_06749 [Exophiala spinifera]KIW13968.1 hypothetical protein PV08_06749 [Exophiala spinifera]
MSDLPIMEPDCSRMATDRPQQSVDTQIHMDHRDHGSHADTNMQLVLAPSHTASRTWKSNHILEKEEYERVRQRVRHVAPEQFKQHARPYGNPSKIFPQNGSEWTQHKAEVAGLAAEEHEKNARALRDQLEAWKYVPKDQRKIVSKFGEQGKIFKDGMSPVLAIPTIWSAEYVGTVADWPLPAEMKWNGDNRESKLARTKVGRFLPPPRAPSQSTVAWHDQPFMTPLPLDQTGPVYTSGPAPSEVYSNNLEMDGDGAFEEKGQVYLYLADLEDDLDDPAQKRPPRIIRSLEALMKKGGVGEEDPGVMNEDDGVAKEDDGVAKEGDGVGKEGDGLAKEDDGVDGIVKDADSDQHAFSDIFSQCGGVTPRMESVEVGLLFRGDYYSGALGYEDFPPLSVGRSEDKPRMQNPEK